MKTQKQVTKYIKKNYIFWIKVIVVLAFTYAIKRFFFKKKNVIFESEKLLKFYNKFNIKIDKKNKAVEQNRNKSRS